MNRKYLIIFAIAIIGITTTSAIALIFYQIPLDQELESLGRAFLITDLMDIPIIELPSLSAYEQEFVESKFRIVNNYNMDLTISLNFTGLSEGWSMSTIISTKIDGNGSYVQYNFNEDFVIPLGSFLDVCKKITNDSAISGLSTVECNLTISGGS